MKLAFRILVNLLVCLTIPVLLIAALSLCKVIFPLIVISGSMEPAISTGSLIFSSSVSTKDLHVGEIASFERSDGVLITHRIVSKESIAGTELYSVRMKGDANNNEDKNPYVQSKALKPMLVIPGLGSALNLVRYHQYEICALFGFGAGVFLLSRILHRMKSKRSDKS